MPDWRVIPVGSQVSVTVGENRIVKREVVTGATKGALSCAQEVCGDVSGEGAAGSTSCR